MSIREQESKSIAAPLGLPTMVSPRALAGFLEVTPLTLQRWREQGKGPAWHQFPGSNVIRYAQADVVAWLAESRVEPR